MTDQEKLEKSFGMRVSRFFLRKVLNYQAKQFNKLQRKKDCKWDELFLDSEKFIFNLNKQTSIYLYKDSLLSRRIYTGFEEDETVFTQNFLRKGDSFFDIGANVGLFSILASPIIGSEGKIFAFEPTPETFRRLNENIQLNSYNNIYPVQQGVSNTESELSFNVATNGYEAWNSFANLIEHEGKAEKITVKTISLDKFIEKNDVDPSSIRLMKIDVEGWELNVMEGAKNLLSSENAPVLMVEFTEENLFAAGYSSKELFDFIKGMGYKWYTYNAKNNQLVEESRKIKYDYSNLFAIKDLDTVKNRLERNK